MRINTKLRHVDIYNMWLRQEHAKGNFEVTYLATDVMLVDRLTKNLSRQKFEHFRALLNLQDIRSRVKKLDQSWEIQSFICTQYFICQQKNGCELDFINNALATSSKEAHRYAKELYKQVSFRKNARNQPKKKKKEMFL